MTSKECILLKYISLHGVPEDIEADVLRREIQRQHNVNVVCIVEIPGAEANRKLKRWIVELEGGLHFNKLKNTSLELGTGRDVFSVEIREPIECEIPSGWTMLPKVIDLNVGGCYLTTKLSTLTKYPDSMLGAMFSGRHVIDKDKDGRYLIDCDSKIFGHILEFLRFGKLPPSGVAEEVLPYSEYFGLQDLSDGLRKRQVPEMINLNVGGMFFTTQLSTLTKYPKSTLASMFSEGPHSKGHAVLQDGRYVIDCDGTIFKHILEFLRFEILPPKKIFEELYRYAKHFKIKELKEGIKDAMSDSSD